MHFTIPVAPPSTPPLSVDALDSLGRLRRQASVLGGLSASFATEAKAATSAYADALCEDTLEAWSRFVGAAASLVAHAESVDEIVHLTEAERKALAFFNQIVVENGDL